MTPSEVHDVLQRLGVHDLHHANTVATSCTFLEHGALLSRGYVDAHNLVQTGQASDVVDKEYGIWDAVFLDHIDIHYRGGKKKGPNQYGPVLFILGLDALLELPPGSSVGVTRKNPIHWTRGEKDKDRWYLTAKDLERSINYGDFDKMLVIVTLQGKVDFPKKRVQIALDDPKRLLSSGADAFEHAEQRLTEAAQRGQVELAIAPHRCQDGCRCVKKYGEYDAGFFESRFI